MKRQSIFFLSAGWLLFAVCRAGYPACPAAVATFPYAEDFESGAGGWTTTGVNNDWTLGTPSKTLISSAASGSNCWITGGLSVSFYQYGERSWVESPCFDFSALDFPVVSFMIYWETESQYDGGNLQYSINGGATWLNIGSANEPSDCFTQHWFNRGNITNLSTLANPASGWSGTSLASSGNCQGGNGSNGWVQARHCLKSLAHQPEVLFRFTFGAGTQCNAFDGLAFDDFRIEESPATLASFTFSCTGANEAEFSNGSTGCISSYAWNFGDGTTSALQNPAHVFQNSGSYAVSLITNSSCSAADTFVLPVTILESSVSATDESCPGTADGSATVIVSPPGVYQYSWNTIPVQTTSAANGLQAGTYTVSVNGAGACGITASATVGLAPDNLSVYTTSSPTSCFGVQDGVAAVVINSPDTFSYTWNTVPVQTTDTATQLAAGTYSVTVSGPGICAPSVFDVVVVEGDDGNPGQFLGSDTSTCSGTEILIQAANVVSLTWDDGTHGFTRLVSLPGTYFAEAVTDVGCRGTDTLNVEERCLDDIVLPNSFTPNNDGVNDTFLAFGTGVVSFQLRIYNRWGTLVFESDSIEDGWDGSYSGHRVQEGIYACMVKYSFDGQNQKTKKGMVVLLH